MIERFAIDYPASKAGKKQWAKEYGMNKYYSGVHWSVRKRDAEFWHLMVRSCINRQGVRRIPLQVPVIVTFRWNDRLDIDNHSVMGKYILDAMKGLVIEDDSRRWVRGVCHFFHDADYISVEVREAK